MKATRRACKATWRENSASSYARNAGKRIVWQVSRSRRTALLHGEDRKLRSSIASAKMPGCSDSITSSGPRTATVAPSSVSKRKRNETTSALVRAKAAATISQVLGSMKSSLSRNRT